MAHRFARLDASKVEYVTSSASDVSLLGSAVSDDVVAFSDRWHTLVSLRPLDEVTGDAVHQNGFASFGCRNRHVRGPPFGSYRTDHSS